MSPAASEPSSPAEAAAPTVSVLRRFPWLASFPAIAVAFAGMAALRLVALSSDAYTRLDWSAGLLTDEGFYSHNARNVVLFGAPRTDDFNNMLLSPLLHGLQVVVFRLFGPGVVPLRMISVVCSLLMLGLLWAALRPVFGRAVAAAAVCVLGFDHIVVLYHRLGLMDTPASLPAVAAFWAFARSVRAAEPRQQRRWSSLAGLLLGLTVTVRSLCAYLAPAPFVALWVSARAAVPADAPDERRRFVQSAAATLWPLALALGLYAALWWWPHRIELAVMNRYYLFHQLIPRSATQLGWNVYHAVLGDYRGIAPYLFRHSPAVFVLALAWLAGLALGVRTAPDDASGRAVSAYLAAWLLAGWGLLAVIAYSPSRYYVTTYPALACAAALGLRSLPDIWARVWRSDARAVIVRALLAWFLAYHAVQSVVHHGGGPGHSIAWTLLYGVPTAAAALCAAPGAATVARAPRVAGRVPVFFVLAWVLVNAVWLADWARHIRTTQIDLSHWLTRSLPAGSVLLGDVAPGVSMDSPFVAVNVIPGLCNGVRPVERFAGRPRFVVILDGRWKEVYWTRRYPELVRPDRRILLRRVLRWDVGVYAVD